MLPTVALLEKEIITDPSTSLLPIEETNLKIDSSPSIVKTLRKDPSVSEALPLSILTFPNKLDVPVIESPSKKTCSLTANCDRTRDNT